MLDFMLEHWVIFAVVYAVGFLAMFIILAGLFIILYREEQAGKKLYPEQYRRSDGLNIILVGVVSTVFISTIWFVILIGAAVAWIITSIKEWWESYE